MSLISGGSRRRRPSTRLTLALLVVAGAATLALPAGAAVPLPATYSVSISPGSVTAGTTATLTITFTNGSLPTSALPLDEATADLAGFSGLSVTQVTAPALQSWGATISGTTVDLRGTRPVDLLLPGQSVSVAVHATAPSAAGTYSSATTAQNRPTSTPFVQNGGGTGIGVTPGAPAQLRFQQQPSTAVAGKAISPAVAVDVLDANGNLVTDPTPVSLTLAVNPSGAALSGNSATSTAGTATFPDLSVTSVGYGYRLSASSAQVQSPPSEPFNAVGTATACPPNQPCTAGPLTGAAGTTRATVRASAGAGADLLTLSVGGFTPYACGGHFTGQSEVVSHDVTGTDRTQTVDLVIDKNLVNATANNGAAKYDVCYADDKPFTTASGSTSGFDSSIGYYTGLLPDCAARPAPCLISRHKNAGNEVLTYLSPAGDPHSIGGITL